jgi:hypothetical protein
MSEEYYDQNLAAMYYCFLEPLDEYLDLIDQGQLPDDEYENLILRAFEEHGITDINMKKLKKSFDYYMNNGEDLTSLPSYATMTPAFDEWI